MNILRYAAAYGRIIEIASETSDLTLPFLPIEWSPERPESPIDRHYRIGQTQQEILELSIDGAEPITCLSASSASARIESDLHHWLATYTRDYLFVHAGCVGWRNRAIVLPGRSYAGKTTMTRALVEAGATYYSDDYAVVDQDGMIWPFPRQLYVRPITPDPPHRLDPVAKNWPIGRLPIRAILVAELRFDRKAGWNVEHLTHGQSTLALLDNTVAARERPGDSLRMMARVMDSAVGIKGTRGSIEESTSRLLAMVDDLLMAETE